jgi:hypothetical protein
MTISSIKVEDLNYNNIQTFGSLQPGETTDYMPLETAAERYAVITHIMSQISF